MNAPAQKEHISREQAIEQLMVEIKREFEAQQKPISQMGLRRIATTRYDQANSA
jgi:hypothetical protein